MFRLLLPYDGNVLQNDKETKRGLLSNKFAKNDKE